MAVHKYKPKATPRALEGAVERAASVAQKTLAESKKAIARSRELMEQSRQAIERLGEHGNGREPRREAHARDTQNTD